MKLLRDLQMRVLHLEISELERALHATRVSMPDVEGIDRDIAALKADLYKARHASDVLSDKLEDPSANTGRAKLLGGRIPEKDELVAKLQVSVTCCTLYMVCSSENVEKLLRSKQCGEHSAVERRCLANLS